MTKTTTGEEHNKHQGIQQLLRHHHYTRGWDSGQFRRNRRTATSSSGSNINGNVVYGFILEELAKFCRSANTSVFRESAEAAISAVFSDQLSDGKQIFIHKQNIDQRGRSVAKSCRATLPLKEHKRDNFFGSNFVFSTFYS